MTIFTFPSALWKVTTLAWPLEPQSASSPTSAFNPQRFTDGPTSEYWSVSATIKPMRADDWRPVAAFLRKLRGRRNKVRLYDPMRPLRGAGGAGPVINVEGDAVAGATSITVRGLTVSQAIALAADDMFGIGENLYALSDDAPSDADGKATISFLPPLRLGVADGDAVNLLNPTGLFQLVSGAGEQVISGSLAQPLTLQFFEDPDLD